MKFTNILFDLDGVLIDSEPAHAEAKRATVARFGLKLDDKMLLEFNGQTDNAFFGHILKEHRQVTASLAELMKVKDQAYLRQAKFIRPIPGAPEFVESLVAMGKTICLVTSSKREYIEAVFRHQVFAKHFKFIICAEDVKKHKPDPEPYLAAAARLGGVKSDGVVIEDSVNGVLAAKAAGFFTAGILTNNTRSQLAGAGADVVAEDYADLKSRLP